MQPAVNLKPALPQQRQEPAPQLGVESLKRLCRQSIEQHLCSQNLCSILRGVEALAPALNELREPLMTSLADNLDEAVLLDQAGFCSLPCRCLADLLDRPGLVRLSHMSQCCRLPVHQPCTGSWALCAWLLCSAYRPTCKGPTCSCQHRPPVHRSCPPAAVSGTHSDTL